MRSTTAPRLAGLTAAWRRIKSAPVRPPARWFLAVILMFAGAGKIVQITGFRRLLVDTGFFTPGEAYTISLALPPVEIVLALLLVLALLESLVATVSLLLALCFTAVHGYAYWNGAIQCGCLGLKLRSGYGESVMLAISVGMLLAALVLTLGPRPRGRRRKSHGPQPVPVSGAPAAD